MSHLPIEILLLIGQDIDDKRDQLNLLLVCKRWQAVFTEHAYHSIEVKGRDIPCLMRSFFSNPRLFFIQELKVRDWGKRPTFRVNARREWEPGEAVMTLVNRICLNFTVEFPRWWLHFQQGNEDAWLAIFLTALPNLKSLDIDYSGPAPFLHRILCRAAPGEHRPFWVSILPQLERVTVTLNEQQHQEVDYIPKSYLLPFRYLPALRSIRCEAVLDDDEFSEDDHLASRTTDFASPVKELIFKQSTHGHLPMAEFVIACEELEVFEYQHHRAINLEFGVAVFDPTSFYHVLKPQKHNLQVLRLNDAGESEHPFFENHHDQWFGSMRGFCQLREVAMRLQNLLDFAPDDETFTSAVWMHDILPSSLESLRITDCKLIHSAIFVCLKTQIQAMMKHRQERFPNLQRISIQPLVKHREDLRTMEEGVITECSKSMYLDCAKKGMRFQREATRKIYKETEERNEFLLRQEEREAELLGQG